MVDLRIGGFVSYAIRTQHVKPSLNRTCRCELKVLDFSQAADIPITQHRGLALPPPVVKNMELTPRPRYA
jgi:hypothetical protein